MDTYCPNCHLAVDAKATACPHCVAVFNGDGWKPLSRPALDEKARAATRPSFLLSRRGMFAYWGVFALYTFIAGTDHGWVIGPVLEPYPWRGVWVMLLVLAVEVIVLYWILRPPTFPILGFFYGGFLFSIGNGLAAATDMSGLYYVPFWFGLVTLLVTIGAAVRGIVDRVDRQPSK